MSQTPSYVQRQVHQFDEANSVYYERYERIKKMLPKSNSLTTKQDELRKDMNKQYRANQREKTNTSRLRYYDAVWYYMAVRLLVYVEVWKGSPFDAEGRRLMDDTFRHIDRANQLRLHILHSGIA